MKLVEGLLDLRNRLGNRIDEVILEANRGRATEKDIDKLFESIDYIINDRVAFLKQDLKRDLEENIK